MIVYLDTSALVKLYAQEVGSTEVRRAVARADLVATSLVAYVEARWPLQENIGSLISTARL